MRSAAGSRKACQDISVAGKGAGLAGERSGLWREYARLIGELRPRFVIVENVAALLGRGLADVLGDLATLGYDAEWHCIPASAVGAPHGRDRLWLLSYADSLSFGRNSRSIFAQEGSPQYESYVERFATVLDGTWPERPSSIDKVPRMDDGISARVVRCLGNAVVPQIPELIGRAIMEAMQ